MKLTLVNGIFTDSVSVFDRGLAFGDGVFTTALVVNGIVKWQGEHITRLLNSLHRLGIEAPKRQQIESDIDIICGQLPSGTFVLKIVLTAGISDRGYARSLTSATNRYLLTSAYPAQYHVWQKEGISLGIAETKLAISPSLAGVKHLNRIEQVMVKNEIQNTPFDDLLVTDIAQNVIEVSAGNIFWFDGFHWNTPSLANAGVDGLVRQKILENEELVRIKDINLIDFIDDVESMFICNCLMGIVPVNTINDKQLSTNPMHQLRYEF